VVRERASSRTHIVAPADVAERVALAPAPGEAPLPAANAAALLRRNGTDPEFSPRPALHFGERSWSHAEMYAESTRYAALFRQRLDPQRPPHVGVLLDNTPEYVFCLAGAALAGAAVVGLNHTRRDEHLLADIGYTDVQLLVTEPRHEELLAPVVGELALPGGLLVSERFADADDPPRAMGEPLEAALAEWAPGGRGDPVGAVVHVGDLGRAEGGAVHPTAAAHHRQQDDHGSRRWPR
jgi:fatty-acyl-CoA synthase